MPDAFIKNNLSIVISFIVAVFTAGGIFAEFTALKDEISLVHDRLDEKIIVISRLEERILTIEKQIEYERGLLEAMSKSNLKMSKKTEVTVKSNGLRNELKEIRKSIDKLTNAIIAQTNAHEDTKNGCFDYHPNKLQHYQTNTSRPEEIKV